MKKSILHLVLASALFLFACTAEVTKESSSPLEGVWQLVSAEWTMEDSTSVYPSGEMEGTSIKCYTARHFFVVGDITAPYSISGTYAVEGESSTEIIGMNSFGMEIGTEVITSFEIQGDRLELSAEWFKEEWKRIE